MCASEKRRTTLHRNRTPPWHGRKDTSERTGRQKCRCRPGGASNDCRGDVNSWQGSPCAAPPRQRCSQQAGGSGIRPLRLRLPRLACGHQSASGLQSTKFDTRAYWGGGKQAHCRLGSGQAGERGGCIPSAVPRRVTAWAYTASPTLQEMTGGVCWIGPGRRTAHRASRHLAEESFKTAKASTPAPGPWRWTADTPQTAAELLEWPV